ncbi:hypothetical protein CDV36_016227 [Fusarium kuroshium]|uniref:Uncharacterized protein n=1 Tax=Fusarium kuroshium TaxID=2010991 RepID=A0A3M2QWV7_9HYPO|nr:hypothetical protein CDV36_016227 [Fusarium kuroshium]
MAEPGNSIGLFLGTELDLAAEAREYVESLGLDESLLLRRDELVRVGQRPSTHVFVAEPRTLTITNFLGAQNTINIDFRQDLPRGLTFLVGDNGSAANDVVNDKVSKNCSVKLELSNGYAIARYRKHKIYKNRVVILLHSEPLPQLEHPDARTTQAAINELLGTDYETYVRTVVLRAAIFGAKREAVGYRAWSPAATTLADVHTP